MMQREIIGIFGIAGHGKSTMIRHLIRPLPRVLALDIGLDDYEGSMTVGSVSLAARLIDGHARYRLVYAAFERTEEEAVADAVELTKAYGASMPGAQMQWLIMDEADLFAPARGLSRPMRDAIARGRHWGLSIIYASRRPAEVNRLLTSQTTRFIVFRTREPGDLRYLKAFIGEDAAARAPTLPKYAYLDIAADGEWTIGRLPEPQNIGP